MSKIIEDIRKDLIKYSDEKTKSSGEKFFKEGVEMYGVKGAHTHLIESEHFKKLPDKSKAMVFCHCDELWTSGIMEESIIACLWSYKVRKDYKPEDFLIFSNWIEKYVSNWATCDTLCNHTVGALIEKYPSFLQELKEWAVSDNRWMRRASAVSLIIPAKKGLFLEDIFQLAEILLLDKDDMVQKGYGWLLKVASQIHQEKVFDFIMARKNVMPRTALRYAIEKMPRDLRIKAMEKTKFNKGNSISK
jgi:3-methyladenine DNA glycosylase AlkD